MAGYQFRIGRVANSRSATIFAKRTATFVVRKGIGRKNPSWFCGRQRCIRPVERHSVYYRLDLTSSRRKRSVILRGSGSLRMSVYSTRSSLPMARTVRRRPSRGVLNSAISRLGSVGLGVSRTVPNPPRIYAPERRRMGFVPNRQPAFRFPACRPTFSTALPFFSAAGRSCSTDHRRASIRFTTVEGASKVRLEARSRGRSLG